MSFFIYDISFLVIFGIFLTIFLYNRKKNIKREGWLLLYRTQLGIKLINYIGDRYPRTLKVLRYVIIAMGYVSMILMIYLLVKSLQIFLNPEIVRLVKIPPLAPLIPYLPSIFNVDFLPPFYFTYWIIALAIVAVVHEFAHGIFSRLSRIRIKSTGFVFLGPFFGAFVEPDEKQMRKRKSSEQMAILGAGTFANWLMVLVFFLLLWLFFTLAYSASGVIFNTYDYGVLNSSLIDSVGKNITINNGEMNLTKISVNKTNYYILSSAVTSLNSTQLILAYRDSPALRAGLDGVIVGINGTRIGKTPDLQKQLARYHPGENVTIRTLRVAGNSAFANSNPNYTDYNITLGKHPANSSIAYIGVASLQMTSTSLMGKIRPLITFFKDPNTYYAPRIAPELMVFIYNLLWWIIFINFSVALVNMLPVGIFDGGKFFYFTMLSIFRSEKVAKIAFSISTYIILGIFVMLMLLWAFAFF